MKGIVFSEFLDFVELTFSIDQVEDMIEACTLESGAAYTSVGTYDYREMVQLVSALSKQTGIDVNTLIYKFGFHLMGVFAGKFSGFVERAEGLFDFLASIDGQIHVEVLKLYPDAELPKFTTIEMTENRMVLDYRSIRCLSPLAEGLIMGAAKYFETPIAVTSREMEESDGAVVRFTIGLENP